MSAFLEYLHSCQDDLAYMKEETLSETFTLGLAGGLSGILGLEGQYDLRNLHTLVTVWGPLYSQSVQRESFHNLLP